MASTPPPGGLAGVPDSPKSQPETQEDTIMPSVEVNPGQRAQSAGITQHGMPKDASPTASIETQDTRAKSPTLSTETSHVHAPTEQDELHPSPTSTTHVNSSLSIMDTVEGIQQSTDDRGDHELFDTHSSDAQVIDVDMIDEHTEPVTNHTIKQEQEHSDEDYEAEGMFVDDDDCVIIDKDSVPSNIKQKWTKHAFRKDHDTPDIEITSWNRIKTEHDDDKDLVDVPQLPRALNDEMHSNRIHPLIEDDFDDGDDDAARSDHLALSEIDDDDEDIQPPTRRVKTSHPQSSTRARTQSDEILSGHIAQNSALGASNSVHPRQNQNRDSLFAKLNFTIQKRDHLLNTTSDPELTHEERYKLDRWDKKIQDIKAQLDLQDSSSDDDSDDGQNAHSRNDSAAARVMSSVEGEDVEDPMEELEPKNGRNPPRKPVKDAREYWQRRYAEMDPKEAKTSNKLPPSGKKSRTFKAPDKKSRDEKAAQLLKMLQYSNPIMARAAQGDMPIPGPIQATTKQDQWKAMVSALTNKPSKDEKENRKQLREATLSFGRNKCKADNGKWQLKDLRTSLYNHQLVGTRWMLGQEFSPSGPYGGILADEMGLGKTVQMLATMSSNMPEEQDRKDGVVATLIVAPGYLMSQWRKEIERHCHRQLISKVARYRNKTSEDIDLSIWQSLDILLCTYNDIERAFPSDNTMKRITALKQKNDQDWFKEYDAALGDIFKMKFYRVVLDEAHAIKNYSARTSVACIQLTSKYRWALSGTPIHNSIDELFPYMKFLGAEWTSDLKEFKKQFGDIENDTVQERLAATIPAMMLRRRVDDTFCGRPILQIPKTHPINYLQIDLSVEERFIYRRLERRFRDNLNQHIKEGTAKSSMRTYFAYLLRLRQATSHPFLLENAIRSDFKLEDIRWIQQKLGEFGGVTPLHQQLRKWIDMDMENRIGDEYNQASTPFGLQKFGYEFDMNRQLEMVAKRKTVGDHICRVCYELPVEPQLTRCGHTFCKECIDSLKDEAKKLRDDHPECPDCGVVIKSYRPLCDPGREETPVHSASEPPEEPAVSGKGKRKKGQTKKKTEREIGDDENFVQPRARRRTCQFLDECDKNPEEPVTPSAKTTAIKNKILEWQKEAPDDKIIVFTQWVDLARIIGRMLFAEEIGFLYYFGIMNSGQRVKAIKDLDEDPEIKVLIASPKCGGQGLNLTAANRVILVDLWWNSAMEGQAYGRVHRIGQTKECHFVKIITKNTIDQRLLDMQNEKDAKIAKILGAGYKDQEITIEDVKRLFGNGESESDEAEDAGVAGEHTG